MSNFVSDATYVGGIPSNPVFVFKNGYDIYYISKKVDKITHVSCKGVIGEGIDDVCEKVGVRIKKYPFLKDKRIINIISLITGILILTGDGKIYGAIDVSVAPTEINLINTSKIEHVTDIRVVSNETVGLLDKSGVWYFGLLVGGSVVVLGTSDKSQVAHSSGFIGNGNVFILYKSGRLVRCYVGAESVLVKAKMESVYSFIVYARGYVKITFDENGVTKTGFFNMRNFAEVQSPPYSRVLRINNTLHFHTREARIVQNWNFKKNVNIYHLLEGFNNGAMLSVRSEFLCGKSHDTDTVFIIITKFDKKRLKEFGIEVLSDKKWDAIRIDLPDLDMNFGLKKKVTFFSDLDIITQTKYGKKISGRYTDKDKWRHGKQGYTPRIENWDIEDVTWEDKKHIPLEYHFN